MGISLSRKLSADLLSFLSFSLKKGSVPAKVYPMPLHDVVNLVSRTGRHLQRYDEGCRQVVGCIPYRFRNTTGAKELEVLMISSQKGSAMMFPKGGWETDESIIDAALRETMEEAGVTGKIEEILGQWRYKSKSQCAYHDGYIFPLLVEEELESWPEKNVRQRSWLNASEAKKVCKQSWMKEALEVFECRLLQQQTRGESAETTAIPFPAQQ